MIFFQKITPPIFFYNCVNFQARSMKFSPKIVLIFQLELATVRFACICICSPFLNQLNFLYEHLLPNCSGKFSIPTTLSLDADPYSLDAPGHFWTHLDAFGRILMRFGRIWMHSDARTISQLFRQFRYSHNSLS